MRATAVINSPIGRLGLEADGDRLAGVSFHARGPVTSGPKRGVIGEAARQLDAYFAGRLKRFSVPLALAGTPFQLSVWHALETIPYGQTWTYGELARYLDRPKAVRAVGAANGNNPIPIIVPCHRVIGSDGRLVGFGGGLDLKRRLLALENTLLF